MKLKVRYRYDGPHIRAHLFMAPAADRTYALLGMLAMEPDEFMALRLTLNAGGRAVGLDVEISEEDGIAHPSEKREGEIRNK